MLQMLRLIFFSIALSSLGAEPVFSQSRPAPEDQIKLGQQFFAQDKKCRGLLGEERWKEAEAACEESVRLADRFADYRELEKLGAYAGLGHALAGQRRFREAIKYYSRAIEVARPRLDDTNAEVADMYVNIAMSYHALRDLREALEWYRKAASSYKAAHARIEKDGVSDEGAEMQRGYMKALKRVYDYHILAAEQSGATAEAEEIKKRLASLP